MKYRRKLFMLIVLWEIATIKMEKTEHCHLSLVSHQDPLLKIFPTTTGIIE